MLERPLEWVLKVTGGRLVGGERAAIRGVSTDTRTLEPGALFVALRGERFDGHDFVREALRRGAAAALVSRELVGCEPLVVVEDTLRALGSLAAAHRRELRPKVIAITGSTGKTTTKEMTAAILSQGWATARTPGNYNNEVGVPLALLGLDPSHRAAVIEVAMRGRGQIAYLADMARPDVGVVTNIGVSHMELLGSRQAIAEAKGELLEALAPDGAAVLNAGDDFYDYLASRTRARVIAFGRDPGADVRVSDIALGADASVRFRLHGWWGDQEITLRAPGRHHALNAAAAAAAAMAAGAEAEWVPAGLSVFESTEMRGRVTRAPGGFTVIDDCYNAAPDSMRVALELLADMPGGRKWAVLGEMKELGPMAADWHREVGELAAGLGIAGLVAVGELGRCIAEGARQALESQQIVEAPNNAAAAAAVAARVRAGDVVLVKGSRAMGMEEIVKQLLAGSEDGRDA